MRMAAKAGVDTSTMDDLQKRAISEAYEKAREEGKTDDEIKAILLGVAAIVLLNL